VLSMDSDAHFIAAMHAGHAATETDTAVCQTTKTNWQKVKEK